MAEAFNIANPDVIELTNKLEKFGRSDMPLAVRGTLNDAAFLSRRMALKKFKKDNIIRDRKFIQSHIIVNKSPNTFDIKKMHSEMGVPKGKSNAGDNLEDIEKGNNISDKWVPSDNARGGSRNDIVRKALYLKKWINKSNGQIYRSGESTIIKTNTRLYRVTRSNATKKDSKRRKKRGGKWTTLYINMNVNVPKRPFIEPAGDLSAKKIPQLFQQNAKKRIDKYYK